MRMPTNLIRQNCLLKHIRFCFNSLRPSKTFLTFEVYLLGRYHFRSYTEEGFAKAIDAYNQAASRSTQITLCRTQESSIITIGSAYMENSRRRCLSNGETPCASGNRTR
jgi:hypothetical protein